MGQNTRKRGGMDTEQSESHAVWLLHYNKPNEPWHRTERMAMVTFGSMDPWRCEHPAAAAAPSAKPICPALCSATGTGLFCGFLVLDLDIQISIQLRCRRPYFEVSGLVPGMGYNVFLIANNSKGRSNATILQVYTLKDPEKQTGEFNHTGLTLRIFQFRGPNPTYTYKARVMRAVLSFSSPCAFAISCMS